MRGNTSKFASFSSLLKSFSNLSNTQQIKTHVSSDLLKIRVFSSFDSPNRNVHGRRNNRNDYDDDNKNDFRRDKGNFSSHENVRGDRQRSQFGRGNEDPNRDFRGKGRRNDGFGKPGGFGEDGNEGKGDYQPSVRELLNSPLKGEKRGEKEDNEFLEKFKLGGVGKEDSGGDEIRVTNSSEEEKMEVSQNADEIFGKMKQSGLIPNAVAMLDGLCKDGLVQEAMKLFGLMREKGTMPEVVVYTAVVEGFCHAGKLDDAKRIFKKMNDNGIGPNAFSYTVLIKGLCNGKRLDEAFDLCLEMLEAGHSPNVPTFTGLVHGFCNEKGVEDARKAIVMLKQKGFFVDEKAVRVYFDKNGPTSPMVWEAIFGPKKTAQRAI